MSELLEQPVLVLRETISYAQFRVTDDVGADMGLIRGTLSEHSERFDLDVLGGEKLASFRWGGEGGLGGTLVKGLQVFAADDRHLGPVVVTRGLVTIADPAGEDVPRAVDFRQRPPDGFSQVSVSSTSSMLTRGSREGRGCRFRSWRRVR